jgi:hypothetical protein
MLENLSSASSKGLGFFLKKYKEDKISKMNEIVNYFIEE